MEDTPIIDILLSSWEEKEKFLSSTYKRLRKLDILTVISSFVGLIVFQIETNYYYEQIEVQNNDLIGVVEGKQFPNVIYYKEEEENYPNFLYRVILLASTCFLSLLFSRIFFSQFFQGYLLILRAKTYLFYLKITNRIEIGASFYSSGILFTLVLELLYNFIISFPKYNAVYSGTQQGYPLEYSFDQITSLAQLGRIYILVRMWTQYSIWNKDQSVLICNLCNTDGGVIFALKSEFKTSPVLVVGWLFTVTILNFGIASRTSERSFSYISGLNWDYVWNGMWMIIIIITTVGYGDFYPRTYLGRVYVFFTCCFGPFLISMVNVSISNYLFFNKEQMRAFEKIKNHEDKVICCHYASDCIKYSWKHWGHLNLKIKSARTNNAQKHFHHIFNRYKEVFLQFRHQRLQVNTAGFNKPFDEALPIFSKKKEEDFDKIITEFTQTATNISSSLEKINTHLETIDILMRKTSRKYENFQKILNRNPYHKEKFANFKSQFLQNDILPASECLPLNLYQISSMDSIKEVLSKEKFETQGSIVSIQSPMSAKSSRRLKSENVTMVEINDIVKQLTKKRKDLKPDNTEDSPRIKSAKLRSNMKKLTMMPTMKRSDELEIIQEIEENKENMLKSKANPTSLIKVSTQSKKSANFILKDEEKKEQDGNLEKRPKIRFSNRRSTSQQKIGRLPSKTKLDENIFLLDESKQESILENRQQSIQESRQESRQESKQDFNKIENNNVITNNNNNNINNNEANISVNFSSQMTSNIPFNMLVNVNTNPIFNLTTNYNSSSNYPFIINVESKNMEKNPNYPDNTNLIEEVKSKTSSSKKIDSFREKNEHMENNILNMNNINNIINTNNSNNDNINNNNNGSINNVNMNNNNSSNTLNNNTNNIFRQRKIVIEHSMHITESFIDAPNKQNTKDSNKSGSGNINFKHPHENSKSNAIEIDEEKKLSQNLSGVD